jgi:hypothetical protein
MLGRSYMCRLTRDSGGVPQVDAAAGADIELCDHVLSLLNAALASPEAQQHLPLRKRFVASLLDKGARPTLALSHPFRHPSITPVCQLRMREGTSCMPGQCLVLIRKCAAAGLLIVLADLCGRGDPYTTAAVDALRAQVKDVVAAPKQAPTPHPPPPRAAPRPPQGRPAAPPPPPPPGMASIFIGAGLQPKHLFAACRLPARPIIVEDAHLHAARALAGTACIHYNSCFQPYPCAREGPHF